MPAERQRGRAKKGQREKLISVINRLILLLFVFAFFGCNNQKDKYIEKNSRKGNQTNFDICAHVKIALDFMNSYTEYCMNVMMKKDTMSDMQWIKSNDLITQDFKYTYDTLTTNARNADPEMGLGFDPILDAQDYPDSGFVLSNCDSNSKYVELKGKDWPEFKVTIKLIRMENQWLVDGAGVINIPEMNRSKR